MSYRDRTRFNADRLKDLDNDKLATALFSWASDMVRELRRLSQLTEADQQHALAQLALLEDWARDNTKPIFSKGLRTAVANVYAIVYEKHTKDLYNVTNRHVGVIATKDHNGKALSVTVLGHLYTTAGDHLTSLAPLAAISLIKQLKSGSHRLPCALTLAHVTRTCGDTFEDSLAKDVSRAARNLISDKSVKVQAAGFYVLECLNATRLMVKSNSDLDNFRSLCLKSLDSPFAVVRQAAAQCLARGLASLLELSLSHPHETLAFPKKSSIAAVASAAPSGTSLGRTASSAGTVRKSRDGDQDDEDPVSRSTTPTNGPNGGSNGSSKKALFALQLGHVLALISGSYAHANTSQKARAGLMQSLGIFLKTIDSSVVKLRFAEIAHCLLVSIAGHPLNSKYKSTAAKRQCHILMDLVLRQLAEYGLKTALKILARDILATNVTPLALVATLEVVQTIVTRLGSAAAPECFETLQPTLLALLEHHHHSVQLAACLCLKTCVLANPNQMLPLMTLSLNGLTKDLLHGDISLKHSQLQAKTLGRASLVASLVGLSASKSQYSSLELSSRVLSTATSLLKSTGNVEVLSVQMHVAWTLVTGLMPLGPAFVSAHLPQFLQLWKAGLHQHQTKDVVSAMSVIEVGYYLHIRHCIMSCVVAFMTFNAKLVTAEVAKRLALLLKSVTTFVDQIPSKRFADDQVWPLEPGTLLSDMRTQVQHQTLAVYVALARLGFARNQSMVDTLFPAAIFTSTVSVLSDPDTNSQLSSAIAAGTGAIDSIWDMGDNNAFGLTSRLHKFDLYPKDTESNWLSGGTWVDQIEDDLHRPMLPSMDFDPEQALFGESPAPVPTTTGIVDLSIQLFAMLLPTQTMKVQESLLDQIQSRVNVRAKDLMVSGTQPSSGPNLSVSRANSILVNSIVAIYEVLKYGLKNNPQALRHSRLIRIFFEILKAGIESSDAYVRNLAAQGVGLLCNIGGSAVTSEYIKFLVDRVVANTEPNSRGGYSLSLAYIVKHVGRMYAGNHLKTILGILVSLSADPHPVVHFWALDALSIVISASGLGFSTFAPSTIASLCKYYLADSHSDEMTSSVGSSNLEIQLNYSSNVSVDHGRLLACSTTRVIARCCRFLINVFGPDLREISSRTKSTILAMVQEFELSRDANVEIDAFRTLQELLIFSPLDVDFANFGRHVSQYLVQDPQLNVVSRDVAVDGLYQLIRTHPSDDVFTMTSPNLKDQIWLVYDDFLGPRDGSEIGRIIESWLEETAAKETAEWIVRIQNVLMKPRSVFSGDSSRLTDLPAEVGRNEDDEGESFARPDASEASAAVAVSSGGASTADSAAPASAIMDTGVLDETLRWQTQALSVKLLQTLMRVLLKNQSVAEKEKNPLVAKIGDVIRIAFSSCTSPVVELRLLGLKLLDEILNELKYVPDPYMRESSLLEQYQAQISSALTPAFSADSWPEVAAQAIRVSATFIGSGVIKDVDRMGRILRILTTGLDSCAKAANGSGALLSGSITLGDLKTQSPSAQAILRISILSLWAELQTSSVHPNKEYLVQVVSPHVATLVPLWINTLRDFARLRFEPEQSSGLSGGVVNEQVHMALLKSTLIPVYSKSWLQMVDAIACLIERDRKLVFEILHEKDRLDDINYSTEAVAFFFVLFGLCVEVLSRSPDLLEQSVPTPTEPSSQRLRVLLALKRILHPSVSGSTIYQEQIFLETVELLNRVILTTSDLREKRAIVEIIGDLCVNHPGSATRSGLDNVSESVDHLFDLYRVVMQTVSSVCPFLVDNPDDNSERSTEVPSPATLALARTCFEQLVSMVEAFPSVIKVDLYACVLHIFGQLQRFDASGAVYGQSLAAQKRLFESMRKVHRDSQASGLDNVKVAIERCVVAVMLDLVENIEAAEDQVGKLRDGLLAMALVMSHCADVFVLCANNESLTDCGRRFGLVLFRTLPQTRALGGVNIECARAIFVSCLENDVGRAVTKELLPLVVASCVDQPQPAIAVVTALLKSHPNSDKALQAMQLTIPMLIQLVNNENSGLEPERRISLARAQLLDLAAFDGGSFKSVVQTRLTAWQRTVVERILRADEADEAQNLDDEPSQTILLRAL